MVAPALAVISGLVQGYAQNKKNKQDKALAEMRTKIALADLKAKETQTKFLNSILGTAQPFLQNKAEQQRIDMTKAQAKDSVSPTDITTPLGDSFNVTKTPGVGVLDQMVGGPQAQPVQAQPDLTSNLAQQPPLVQAAFQKISGLPINQALSLQQRVRADERLERQGDERIDIQQKNLELRQKEFDRKAGEFKPLIVKNLDGSTTTMLVPKFGMAGGRLTTTPPSKKLRIKDADLPLWINLETLQTPAVGITPEEAQANGFVRVTTGQKEAVKGFATTEVVIDKIEQLMNDVFPEKGGIGERLLGAPKRSTGAFLQSNQKAAELDSLIKGTLAPIIRALGEKGALSDTDVKRAINLLPALTDSADVARGKIGNLKDLFMASKQSVLGATIEKAKNTAENFMSK
jgi:hypothetical protein